MSKNNPDYNQTNVWSGVYTPLHSLSNKEMFQVSQITHKILESNQQEIVSVWINIWEDTPWAEHDFKDPELEAAYIRQFIDQGIALQLKKNNQIIGFLFAKVNHHKDIKDKNELSLVHELTTNTSYSTLDELVLDKNFRGQSLGKKLIDSYFKFLENHNIDKIILYTEVSSKSHNFYQKLGFQVVGKPLSVENKNLPSGIETKQYYQKLLN